MAGAFAPPAAERGAVATVRADPGERGYEVLVLLLIVGSAHESAVAGVGLRAVVLEAGFFETG